MLAGGAGTRFGACKQLAVFEGRRLVEHALIAQQQAPLDRRVVVLGACADQILAAVDLHGAEAVVCSSWMEGQAASLRAGIKALWEADAVVVCLGDQPLVSSSAIERVIAARSPGTAVVRATYAGVAGHPVLLEHEVFPKLLELQSDIGARALFTEVETKELACDGLGRPDDVDTPQQLEGLRT